MTFYAYSTEGAHTSGIYSGNQANCRRISTKSELLSKVASRSPRLESVHVTAVIANGHRPCAHRLIFIRNSSASSDHDIVAGNSPLIWQAKYWAMQVDSARHLCHAQRRRVTGGSQPAR